MPHRHFGLLLLNSTRVYGAIAKIFKKLLFLGMFRLLDTANVLTDPRKHEGDPHVLW